MAIVIDASVVLALLLQEDNSQKAETIFRMGGTCAPNLLNLEVCNGIVSGIRRKRINKIDGKALIDAFSQLPITFDEQTAMPEELFQTVISCDLTSYDATYLMLAQRLKAPLATFDVRLSEAAKSLKIRVI